MKFLASLSENDVTATILLQFQRHLKKRGLSEITITNYASDVESFVRWHKTLHRRLAMAAISAEECRRYREFLTAHERLQPSTIRRSVSSLRCLFRFARKKKWLNHEPERGFFLGQQKRTSRRKLPELTAVQEKNLFTFVHRHTQSARPDDPEWRQRIRDLAMLILILKAGAKSQELHALRGSDVSLVSGKEHVVLGAEGNRRTIPITHPETILVLNRWSAIRRARVPSEQRRSEYFFLTRSGKPMQRCNINVSIHRAAQTASRSLTPALLRRAFVNRIRSLPIAKTTQVNLIGLRHRFDHRLTYETALNAIREMENL